MSIRCCIVGRTTVLCWLHDGVVLVARRLCWLQQVSCNRREGCSTVFGLWVIAFGLGSRSDSEFRDETGEVTFSSITAL